MPQRNGANVEKQQHQFRGESGIPDPPGSPHRFAPCGTCHHRNKGKHCTNRRHRSQRQIGHFHLPDQADKRGNSHRGINAHRPDCRRNVQINNAIALPLLIVCRRKTKAPDPSRYQYHRAGNRQPRDKPATDLIEPRGHRQLMKCFPHSSVTRLHKLKSVVPERLARPAHLILVTARLSVTPRLWQTGLTWRCRPATHPELPCTLQPVSA